MSTLRIRLDNETIRELKIPKENIGSPSSL